MKPKAIIVTWSKEGAKPTFKEYATTKEAKAAYPNSDDVFDAQLWTSVNGCVKRKPLQGPKAKAAFQKKQVQEAAKAKKAPVKKAAK